MMTTAVARIYAEKIKSGAINQKTGEPWKLEDVPERWREEVKELLSENGTADAV